MGSNNEKKPEKYEADYETGRADKAKGGYKNNRPSDSKGFTDVMFGIVGLGASPEAERKASEELRARKAVYDRGWADEEREKKNK